MPRTLILGASGNLGSAIAVALHSHGHRLLLHGLKGKDRLDDLAARVSAERTLTADITNEAAVQGVFEVAGPLDCVIFTVGVNPAVVPVAELAAEDWQRTLNVNLFGAFLTAKHAIPALRQSKDACVVFVSSIFGEETPARRAAYGASKHGLRALVQALTKEEGAWLRTNAVCPGPMWSDVVRRVFSDHATAAGISFEEYVLQRVADVPAGRFAELSECAELVAFLVAPEAAFIRGECIRFTGGAVR